MRILHICHSDRSGGAAIAARRLVLAQRAAGMDAQMLVVARRGSEDWVHQAPASTRVLTRLSRAVLKRVSARLAPGDPGAMRTAAILPTGLGSAIARVGPDIVHWHWVGNEMISLPAMAGVKTPAVWTAHDEWAWLGAEHYARDERFISGYSGNDIDARVFARKRREWAQFRPVLIGPSNWIAGRARQSVLFGDRDIRVIPNTLDLATFAPGDVMAARRALGLPAEGSIILFGAQGGTVDPRKGFDLLVDALAQLPDGFADETTCVSFGGAQPEAGRVSGLRHIEIGSVTDEAKLCQLYRASTLFAAPSRIDNLPNTMLEALAVGTPCVGFAVGGLPDLVTTPDHGRLVPAYDSAALAQAIVAVIEAHGPERAEAVRQDIEARFAPDRIAQQHAALYREMLGSGAA